MSRFFGNAVHAGFVVPDIDEAMGRMLAMGIGPFFVMRRIRVAARYRGARHDVLISAAFTYSGDLQIEYVQQHDDTPSAYREFLTRNPAGGMHHVAYFCPEGFQAAFARCAAQGTAFTVVQEFISPDGAPYELYAEPDGAGNPLLMQLMLPGPMEPWFEAMKDAAASWDGQDSVRDVLAMLPREMRPPVEPAGTEA